MLNYQRVIYQFFSGFLWFRSGGSPGSYNSWDVSCSKKLHDMDWCWKTHGETKNSMIFYPNVLFQLSNYPSLHPQINCGRHFFLILQRQQITTWFVLKWRTDPQFMTMKERVTWVPKPSEYNLMVEVLRRVSHMFWFNSWETNHPGKPSFISLDDIYIIIIWYDIYIYITGNSSSWI